MIYSLMSKERKMVGLLTAFDIIASTRENRSWGSGPGLT